MLFFVFVVWVLHLVAGPYANVCCLGVASCRQPLRQCLMHIRTCTCTHAGTCMHTHIHRCNSVPILLQLCRHQRFPSISVFHSSWLRSAVHPQATATSNPLPHPHPHPPQVPRCPARWTRPPLSLTPNLRCRAPETRQPRASDHQPQPLARRRAPATRQPRA